MLNSPSRSPLSNAQNISSTVISREQVCKVKSLEGLISSGVVIADNLLSLPSVKPF